MSHTRKGILAAIAIVAMSFGAAQFAAGENLTVGMRTTGMPDQGVNRAAKTDRAPILAGPVTPMRTISIHVDRFPDTSVLVRIPAAHEAQSGSAPGTLHFKSSGKKRTFACEPVVSVLTEIAKQLEPGRCLT